MADEEVGPGQLMKVFQCCAKDVSLHLVGQ